MKRLIYYAMAAALGMGVWIGAPANVSAGDKVPMCHFDEGGDYGHIIEVSSSAVQTHLDKGDLLDFYQVPGTDLCSAPLE